MPNPCACPRNAIGSPAKSKTTLHPHAVVVSGVVGFTPKERPTMPKVDRETLRKVEAALDRYTVELQESPLRPKAAETYRLDAARFVRWLGDKYVPGENVGR